MTFQNESLLKAGETEKTLNLGKIAMRGEDLGRFQPEGGSRKILVAFF